MLPSLTTQLLLMEFHNRLTVLRKERGLTQKALSEKTELHITQIQRYESGSTQPALDVIRKLAIALSVTADMLVFDKNERGPGDDLRLQFEAVSQFDEEDKLVAQDVLEGLILKHQAKQSMQRSTATKAKNIKHG